MTQNIGSGTAKGLVEYLEALVEKGRAPAGAISPLKIAFTKMLQTVEGESWESVDVRQMDLDDYSSRFANLTRGNYTSDSLRIYANRVKKVVSWYVRFLSEPGWVPSFRQGTKSNGKSDEQKKTHKRQDVVTDKKDEGEVGDATSSTASNAHDGDGLIAYPFPLSSGQLVTLYLPLKIQKVDANRLAAFLNTLVISEED